MNPYERERRLVVRAGLFIGLALFTIGLVVLILGKERNLFSKKVAYRAAFENVDGLQLDAPVRLGGLQAGRVSAIEFATDLKDTRILVTMEVAARFRERVRTDSIARVTSRGVLGDKAIDISLGTEKTEPVPHLGELQTGSSGDISSVLKATGEVVDNVVAITRDLKSGVSAYTAPAVQEDVSSILRSVRGLLKEAETGKGTVHALLYDVQTRKNVESLLASAASSANRLDHALAEVDGLLGEVRSGGGALHALIYDRKIASAIGELGKAADELAGIVHDVKNSKDGAVHQLIYGNAKNLFSDLGDAAKDVKEITSKVKAGEGSLGALINDPTVYEDLKEVLGNVKRNRVLRELVRFSISNGEKLDGVGKPAKPPAAP